MTDIKGIAVEVHGRRVSLPKGCVPVTEGVCREGDRFLDVSRFPAQIAWLDTESMDWGQPHGWFDLLVRPA